LVFDPAGLNPSYPAPDYYKARLTVSDDGTPLAAVTNEILLEVVTTAPVLTTADSDGDGVQDNVESYDDSDGDGIPDYLDHSQRLGENELQQIAAQSLSYVMRTEAGLLLRLGDIAFAAGSDSAQVTVDDIANFGDGEGKPGAATAQDTLANVGGYFDFEIARLPLAGQSAKIVIPQLNPIPSGAVYRKYTPLVGWRNFVEDANNSLTSALGEPGDCPWPGDEAYTPGLTEGHLCIQLMIEDGGPNDTDGIANHVIEDPAQIGVIDQSLADNEPEAAGRYSGGGAMSLLVMLALILRRKTLKKRDWVSLGPR